MIIQKKLSWVIGIAAILSLFSSFYAEDPPDLVWTRDFDGGGNDVPWDIAADAEGNVYVTGYSWIGTDYNYRTMKYDSYGSVEWNRVYDLAGDEDLARGVALDPTGNVYVTGSALDPVEYEYYLFTVKYSNDGDIQDTAMFNSYQDHGYDVAINEQGDVYVTGMYHSGGFENQYRTIKYSPDFNIIWNDTIDHLRWDDPKAITADGEGNVYVGGSTRDDQADPYNFYTVKYDGNGNLEWDKEYDAGDDNEAEGIAADGQGNVYVIGRSYNGADYDFLLVCYDTYGSVQWFRVYDSGSGDWGFAVATDPAGYVYVTGAISSGPDWDILTIKYDPEGDAVWTKTYDSGSDDIGSGIAYGSDGFLYVCAGSGTSFGPSYDYLVIKYRHYAGITGRISGEGEVSGIEVQLSGDASGTTTTNTSGYYEFTDLACDGDFTVTPYWAGHTFTPPSYSYSPLAYDRFDQDFVCTEGIAEEPGSSGLTLDVTTHTDDAVIIEYSLPVSSRARLCIYDASGALVKTLPVTVGNHSITFDCGSGVYFVRLETPTHTLTEKLVLVR